MSIWLQLLFIVALNNSSGLTDNSSSNTLFPFILRFKLNSPSFGNIFDFVEVTKTNNVDDPSLKIE